MKCHGVRHKSRRVCADAGRRNHYSSGESILKLAWWYTMPIVPHYPSDEPDEDEETPDFGEIVDRILNGGSDPTPVVSAAGA